jgi:hypothetical protein
MEHRMFFVDSYWYLQSPTKGSPAQHSDPAVQRRAARMQLVHTSVLRDTLCSCETYGMRPTYKEKKTMGTHTPTHEACGRRRMRQLSD